MGIVALQRFLYLPNAYFTFPIFGSNFVIFLCRVIELEENSSFSSSVRNVLLPGLCSVASNTLYLLVTPTQLIDSCEESTLLENEYRNS